MGETGVGHETHLVNSTDLGKETRQKLIEYGLIPASDNVRLRPTHRVIIHGEWFSHFIVKIGRASCRERV